MDIGLRKYIFPTKEDIRVIHRANVLFEILLGKTDDTRLRNPGNPFAQPKGSVEPSLENTGLTENSLRPRSEHGPRNEANRSPGLSFPRNDLRDAPSHDPTSTNETYVKYSLHFI